MWTQGGIQNDLMCPDSSTMSFPLSSIPINIAKMKCVHRDSNTDFGLFEDLYTLGLTPVP